MAITSAFQADDAGSISAARSDVLIWAQLVERTRGRVSPQFDSGYQHPSFLSFPVSLLLLFIPTSRACCLVDVVISPIYPCLRDNRCLRKGS